MSTNKAQDMMGRIQEIMGSYIKKCVECEREFDMTDEQDVIEYSFGHDCEA